MMNNQIEELRKDYLLNVHNSPKFMIWWYPIWIYVLSFTWWKLKFEYEFHISIPFYANTVRFRKIIGWHHYSDDEGDC